MAQETGGQWGSASGAGSATGAQGSPVATEHPIEFRGSGGEFFGIWIVNLLLTILTLGIYSAWAKVRTQKYFCQCTSVDGASFEYHGRPLAILLGRIIAIALLILYNFAPRMGFAFASLVFLSIGAVMPWLLHRSLIFRLQNISYRGLRFRFAGSLADAYRAFLLWPLFVLVTLGVGLPLAYQRIKRYQHCNSRFGGTAFSFDATAGSFYLVYFQASMLGIAGLLGAVLIVLALVPGFFGAILGGHAPAPGTLTMPGAGLLIFALWALLVFYSVGIGAFVQARIQNLIWNHTMLGRHGFRSEVHARRLVFIGVTNFLGIVFTLGLFKPFAVVRMLRYRLECTTLLARGALEDFVAEQDTLVGAAGMESAEIFDIDIAL